MTNATTRWKISLIYRSITRSFLFKKRLKKVYTLAYMFSYMLMYVVREPSVPQRDRGGNSILSYLSSSLCFIRVIGSPLLLYKNLKDVNFDDFKNTN